MNRARAQCARTVTPSVPGSVGLTLPTPEHLAFYAGIGAMALFGIMEWPVVAALMVGHTLVNAQHNKVLQALGEALEECLAAIYYEPVLCWWPAVADLASWSS